MRIGISSDHGAYAAKAQLAEHLRSKGYEVTDFGCEANQTIDYPDAAVPVCEAVVAGKLDRGILMCGTGIGASIIANKVRGIRCAHCTDSYSAMLTRAHNDSNVLALGGRITGGELICEIADVWLATPFSGDERHQRRIDKISNYEKNA